jgi:hypothetical protein
MLRRTIAGLALLALAAAAPAKEPQGLAPTSPWTALKSENSCKLSRSFGEGKDRTVLVFERTSPDGTMNLLAFGPGLRSGAGGLGARLRLIPIADHVIRNGLNAVTARGETAIQWTMVRFAPQAETAQRPRDPSGRVPRDPVELAARRAAEAGAAARITAVSITEPRGRRVLLQTGAMDGVLATLQDCARDQLRGWGLDPAVQDRIVLGAMMDRPLTDYITSSDYPKSAVARTAEAIITARLIIGADGKVSRCMTLTDFAEPELAEVVCRKVSEASNQPAELADGTKVPSFLILRFRFQIPS